MLYYIINIEMLYNNNIEKRRTMRLWSSRLFPMWIIALAVVIQALTTPTASAAPSVVASILPIHSLVAGVMEGVGKPQLLLRANVSPHSYALRPVDARKLHNADLVFWIDDNLESFLTKPLSALGDKAVTLKLATAPGLVRHPIRRPGTWRPEKVGEDYKHDEHEADAHEHNGSIDLHIWLNPMNAKVMVGAISQALVKVDPANAQAYRSNATRLASRLNKLDREIKTSLNTIRGRPYVVMHDAFQYFERRYGLEGVGALTLTADRAPGVRRLRDIRRRIKDTGVTCIFSEAQTNPSLVNTVGDGTGARQATLDPIGVGLTPGTNAYFDILRGMASTFHGCLSTPS